MQALLSNRRYFASLMAGSAIISGYCATDSSLIKTAQGEDVKEENAKTIHETKIKRFMQWLESNGADVARVEVKPMIDGSGFGLFVSSSCKEGDLKRSLSPSGWLPRWLWPRRDPLPLASFPLDKAITAHKILNEASPAMAYDYKMLIEEGLLDERALIIAFLASERVKGPASSLSPWIDILPNSFPSTPVSFASEPMMDELKGTPLFKAAKVIRGRLENLWHRIKPALIGATSSSSPALGGRKPTFEDLVWAHNVFWSRGQSIPVSNEVHEGLVPGLDFCNHHPLSPKCYWEVSLGKKRAKRNGKDDTEGLIYDGARVELRFLSFTPDERRGALSTRPGDELTISYGDKSNEELLMLHGFAIPGNPNDRVMLALPVPPPPTSAWDEATVARIELIKRLGCGMQFFLPSIAEAELKGSDGLSSIEIPLDLLAALEVLSLKPGELAAKLSSKEDHSPPAVRFDEVASILDRIDKIPHQEVKDVQEKLGLRMGALATLVKMLELRVQELEGDQGTGTMERDRRILMRITRTLKEGEHSGGGKDDNEALRGSREELATRAACIIYRSEQKRMTRAYLVAARIKLQQVLTAMQKLGS